MHNDDETQTARCCEANMTSEFVAHRSANARGGNPRLNAASILFSIQNYKW